MKTNKFLNFAKYPLLLFILIFCLSIGTAQNLPKVDIATNMRDIGGQSIPKNPDHYRAAEIGGDRRLTAPNEIVIGGGMQVTEKREYSRITSEPIGGQSSPCSCDRNIIASSNADFAFASGDKLFVRSYSSEIGGGQAIPRNPIVNSQEFIGLADTDRNPDIGGDQTQPRNFLKFIRLES